MFKTGIYTLKQLKDKKNYFTVFGKQKNVSITLYDQIHSEAHALSLTEHILLVSADDRGAYKRTYNNRFEEFDKYIIELMSKQFDDVNIELLIYDVGVSDGRTAVDFFSKIYKIWPNVSYNASDYNPYLYILKQRWLTITLTAAESIIEILYPPFVFNISKPDNYNYYPINYLLYLIINKFILPKMLESYRAGLLKAKPMTLFSQQALKCAEQHNNFVLSQSNILNPIAHPGHVFRAMNVLNKSYFNDDEFNKIIKNVYHGLHNQGVFITGSNQEAHSQVHGGIYQKSYQGFKLIGSSGEGSSIHDKIMNFKT